MISTNARRCPQCGEPAPHATRRQQLIGLGVVFVIILAMFAWMHHVSSEQEKRFEERKRELQP